MDKKTMDKKTMIAQGYVPATCELREDLAALLIMAELRAGRDPCAGCNHDRLKCHGRPPADSAQRQYHSVQRMEEMTMEAKMQRAIDDDPTFSKNTIPGVDMGVPGGDKSVGMLVGEDPRTRQRRIWAMWDASSPESVAEARERRRIEECEEQRRRDAESEEIAGDIFGLDEEVK